MTDIRFLNCNIVVPKNKQGMEDYEYCLETENVMNIDFPSEEVACFYENDFDGYLNRTFGMFIGEWEPDVVSNAHLKDFKAFVEPYKDKMPAFYNALCLAIEYDTELGIEI